MEDKCLQAELWYECNSRCKYCYLGKEVIKTRDEIKLRNLQAVLDRISDLDTYKTYNKLSYLGGEFFQGQLNTPVIKDKFMELMDKTAWLLENDYIKSFWLYATLTIGDQRDLYETINRFKFKKEQFWILTSYDTIGRFHSPKMLETWDYHMKNLHKMYPELSFNITTILTEDLIQKYLNNEFSFKDMMRDYSAKFFIKYPWLPEGMLSKTEFERTHIANFFPKRESYLKFLAKFRQEEGYDMWDRLFSFKYRANVCLKNANDDSKFMVENKRNADNETEFEEDYQETLPCGHMESCACYIDSDKCCACDKIGMEMLEEIDG